MFSYRTACYLGKTVAPGGLSGKHIVMLTALPEAVKSYAILFSAGSVGRNGKRKEASTRNLTPLMPLVTTECKTFPSLAVACCVSRISANARSPTIGRFCGMIDEISVRIRYIVPGNERSQFASEILHILGGPFLRRRNHPHHLDAAHRSDGLILHPAQGGS